MSNFQIQPLCAAVSVGAVFPTDARLWIRSQEPFSVAVQATGTSAGTRQQFQIPQAPSADRDFAESLSLAGHGVHLQSASRYRYEVVTAGGNCIGAGDFETSPATPDETPERFAIALASCHEPFDDAGAVEEGAASMLQAANACFEQRDVKLAFFMGDQLYADCPFDLSLFDEAHLRQVSGGELNSLLDASDEQIRKVYQQRYRHFFALPSWQQLTRSTPCYPILDDHEIVDNWGSGAKFLSDDWQRVGRGARLAYLDYQHSRVVGGTALPDEFSYEVSYGVMASFVFDLRSQRSARQDGQLVGDEQFTAFRGFLNRHTDKQILLVVLSVPPVHLPRWAAWLAARVTRAADDFSDRWSTPRHRADRDRLLAILHEHQNQHPAQRVILLGGDIHIGCAHEIVWTDGTPPLYQFVSSAITHQAGRFVCLASALSICLNRKVDARSLPCPAKVRRLKNSAGRGGNPFIRLNIGLLNFRRDDTGRYATRFELYSHAEGTPECVFRSVWL